MKQITLSDHAGAKASEARTSRNEEYATSKASYEQLVQRRSDKAEALRQSSRAQWRDQHYGAWLLSLLYRVSHAMTKGPPPPRMRAPGRDEIVWSSGSEGEQLLGNRLAGMLDDQWTLFSGYRNQKGEIDKLLVGPSLVLAIEIKYINGLVHCDGASWFRDKYDRYGNRVQSGVPITDKRGRGPAEQVNAPATILEHHLRERGAPCQVRRAVVLTHPQSKLGSIVNAGVDVVTTLERFDMAILTDSFGARASYDPKMVMDVIQRSHLQWEHNSQRTAEQRPPSNMASRRPRQ